MGAETGAYDWRDRKIREWLLLLLRFAVTREQSDRSAVLAMADELDSVGLRWRPAAPRFFLRASSEICEAILASDGRQNDEILRRYAARIDDVRLRSAFKAAVGLKLKEELQRPGANVKRRKKPDLWKGLPTK